ncbi:hypothetical protein [Mucilaginibacter paludis]|uniref:hypothetical protein n=1 Tax=Mucilaginibacter paludis TaxID=423351 RepID=UPI0012F76715|nr:hypothetical protein [Mucilaginibacter paludis]
MFELLENLQPDFPQSFRFIVNPAGAPAVLAGEPQIKLYETVKDAVKSSPILNFKWYPLERIINLNAPETRPTGISFRFTSPNEYVISLIVDDYPTYRHCRGNYIEVAINQPVRGKRRYKKRRKETEGLVNNQVATPA